MSKIIRAINSMIINSDKISEISKWKNKYSFLFDNKFVWSIEKTFNNNILLTIYPKYKDLDVFFEDLEIIDTFDSITYQSLDYETKEATESFMELFTVIQEKALKVDEALNAIIDLSFD